MGQVTIYLEDEIEEKMRAAAEAEHISKSKWVTNLIKQKVADDWPESFVRLSGAWQDLPEAEEIRGTQVKDSKREAL